VRVLTTIRRAEYFELVVLFFLHAMAMGMWFVPLGAVLDGHGMTALKPYAFATSALAAFVSPLVFGAMADRHASPVVVLRGLAVATALTMALASTAIQQGWRPWLVLVLIQLHALCTAPTFSITTAIVLSRLQSAPREFGQIRAMATFGWMAGCWVVSLLGADASAGAGYAGAVVWLVVAAYTYVLPAVAAPKSAGHVTFRQRMGWDALALLKNRNHRVVFITAALFNIPLAALFPYTPPNLRELGIEHTTAWMSLAQVTEIIAMFLLAGLLARWRIKWIFVLGLGLGLLRYSLCAVNGRLGLIAGISLHGCAFTFVLITAQIYLDQRVNPAWRARAQALFSLMTSGVGNLIGFLGTGWWFAACTPAGTTRWPVFWGGLAVVVALVLIYFLTAYQGISAGATPAKEQHRAV
jgi:nucleoside transporter